MKRLLFILFFLLLLTTCKKEEPNVVGESLLTHAWQLSMQSISTFSNNYYEYGYWMDSSNNIIYTGMINQPLTNLISGAGDTVFPGLSASYSSREWRFHDNGTITDTYYDENMFPYLMSQHSYTRDGDKLVISFQTGDVKEFGIHKLNASQLHIISMLETYYYPLFDSNGIYQDTVRLDMTNHQYSFDKNYSP
jgi:hypothetical protein